MESRHLHIPSVNSAFQRVSVSAPQSPVPSLSTSPGTMRNTSPHIYSGEKEYVLTPTGSPTGGVGFTYPAFLQNNNYYVALRSRRRPSSPDDNFLETIITTLKKTYSAKEPCQKPLPWQPNKKETAEDSFVDFEIGELNRAGRFVRLDDYNPEDLFKSCIPNEEPPTKILLQGEAGFGKTTICTKMAYDWATKTNSHVSHFTLLIFFRLRILQSGNLEDTILNIITKTCQMNGDQGTIQQRLKMVFRNMGTKLLLILDGLDELPGNAERAAVERIIKGHKSELQSFFGGATVLVTTRPIQPSNVVRSFQQYFNIKGFSSLQQELYINRNFLHAPSRAKLLKIELLRPSGTLYGLGRCPLMLYLICFLHQKEDLSELRRKTDIFMSVLRFLAARCAENIGVQFEDSFSATRLPYHELFVKLGFICLNALLSRRLHVKEKEIAAVFPDENERKMALGLGILKKVSMFFRISDELIYETVYKSMMEFLAALYLESIFREMKEEEQYTKIQDFFAKCDPQTLYQIVIFLCGLLGPRAHVIIKMLTIPEITGPSGLAIIPLDLNVIVPDDLQDANLRVAFISVLLNECGSSPENVEALLDRVSADDRIEHSAAHLSSMFWRGYTDVLSNKKKKIHRLTFVFHSTIATSYHNLLLQHITTALREAEAVEEVAVQIAWVPDGLPAEEFTLQECEYQSYVMDTFCGAVFSNPNLRSLILDIPQPLFYRFVRLLRTACPKDHFRRIRIFGKYGHEDLQKIFQELDTSSLHEKFNTLDIGFTLSSDSSFASLLRNLALALTGNLFTDLVVCDGRRKVIITCTQCSRWKPIFDVTLEKEEGTAINTTTGQKLVDVESICGQMFPPADHDMLFELKIQKQEATDKPDRLFLGIKNCLGTWKDFIQQGATIRPVGSDISFRISQVITFCAYDEGDCADQPKPCDVSGRMKRELASCLGINSIFGISTFFRYPALLS